MSDSTGMERDEQLLADRALFGLDDTEAKELENLMARGTTDDLSFETAAAAMDLAMTKVEPMPAALKVKIVAEGKQLVASRISTGKNAPGNEASGERADAATNLSDSKSLSEALSAKQGARWAATDDLSQVEVNSGGFNTRELISWATAVAVAFVAFFVWSTKTSETARLSEKLADQTTQAQLFEIDLVEARKEVESAQNLKRSAEFELKKALAAADSARLNQQSLEQTNQELLVENRTLQMKLNPEGSKLYEMVAKRDNVIRWQWKDVEEAGVEGDVVWDPDNQEGAMRFVGLAKNDPAVSQYQLWIIEENGRKHPVDGGVFNITDDDLQGTGEVYKPINAKLFAKSPSMFAITVESPSGVVVSDRDKLPLLAQAPKELP